MDITLSLLRAVLAYVGGTLIARGYIAADIWALVEGAVVSLGTAVWSWRANALGLEQALGVTRAVLAAAGGFARQKGWIDDSQLEQTIGASVAVVTTLWGALFKTATKAPSANIPVQTPVGRATLGGLFVGVIGAKLAALVVMGSLLSGCATVAGVASGVAASDAVLTRLSQGSLPLACQTVEVAAGYFDALKARISAANVRRGEVAIMAARDICASPPRSTLDAIMLLSAEWTKLQAATRAK